MKDFIIFTDGDVDVPKPYDRDVVMLPQYYYFDPNVVYGDEQILTREAFFEHPESLHLGRQPGSCPQPF